jgi:PAS domain S-box-containing protein
MAVQPTRILVVEDEAAHAEAVSRAFEGLGGMQLRLMTTLGEFQDQAASWEPDIALVDLNLPDGRALDLLADSARSWAFPVIIMTSHPGDRTAVEVLKAGAFDFLVKSPETFSSLPRHVERLLRDWQVRSERRRAEEALREAHQYHEQIIRCVQGGLVVYSLDLRVELWNPFMERMTGLTAQAVLGKPILELFPFLETVGILARMERSLAGESCGPMDFPFHIPSTGKGGWASDSTAPLRNAKGAIIGVIEAVRDITEQKQAAEESRASRQLFVDAFALSPDSININRLDDGVYIAINEGFTKITGYTEADVLGRSSLSDACMLWVDPKDRERLVAGLQASGEVTGLEAPFRRKDGQVVTGLMSAKVLEIKGERNILSITRDITERKRLEAALEQRIIALTRPLGDGQRISFEELFNLPDLQRLQDEFARATGVASIITRPDGTPLTAPSNFTPLCGEIIRRTEKGRANCFRSDAALGRCHPEGPVVQTCLSGGLWDTGASIMIGGHHVANWLIGQVRDATQTEENMRAYARSIEVDEASFLNAFRAVPAMPRARFEQIAQALFTLANQLSTMAHQNIQQARFIAERDAAEARIRCMTEELEQRVIERTAQLEAANRELEAFSYSVSHDLRAPLRSIDGFIRALVEDYENQFDETGRHYLDRIRAGSRRMEQLIEDLLKLSRVSRGGLERTEVDLAMLCRKVLGELALNQPERSVAVAIPERLAVRADRHLLRVVLENLLGNAWKFTVKRENPRIEVGEARSDKGESAVFIRDNGAGFDMAKAGKLFNAFQRLHTVQEFEGTGIGLAIVQRIIHRHGGQVWAEATPGEGATFYFTLPDGGAEA